MHNFPYVKTYYNCSLKTILKILGNVTYPKVFESKLKPLFQREIPTASEELLHDRAIPGAQVRVRLCPVLLPLQEDRELQASTEEVQDPTTETGQETRGGGPSPGGYCADRPEHHQACHQEHGARQD